MTRATRAQVIQIAKLLDENIVKNPDDTAVYKAPWTDEIIARQVGCSPTSVGNLRRELYGNFPSVTRTGSARLDTLEARIDTLDKNLAELDGAVASFLNKIREQIENVHSRISAIESRVPRSGT